MKIAYFCSLFLLFLPIPGISSPDGHSLSINENEVEVMEHLIKASERRLQVQKELKAMMEEFNVQKDRFFKGDQRRKQAYRMVKMASRILSVIQTEHLQHLFLSDYLEELALFSSIAGKTKLAR